MSLAALEEAYLAPIQPHNFLEVKKGKSIAADWAVYWRVFWSTKLNGVWWDQPPIVISCRRAVDAGDRVLKVVRAAEGWFGAIRFNSIDGYVHPTLICYDRLPEDYRIDRTESVQ